MRRALGFLALCLFVNPHAAGKERGVSGVELELWVRKLYTLKDVKESLSRRGSPQRQSGRARGKG